jgi:hypothetical protein
MPQYVEKPTIFTMEVDIRLEARAIFAEWQAKCNERIVAFPGFVSIEFLHPSEQQRGWLIVQRFSNAEAVSSWQKSSVYQSLLKELQGLVGERGIQETLAEESSIRGGVTEVMITEVSPQNAQAYREWSSKIHQFEAKFPGFRGVYVQAPTQGKGTHWITLLQFDTMDNLDRWFDSPERQRLLSESAPLISSLESHRVISPYAGWFASIAKVGEMPSVWKQNMIVLLILFPTVMLEIKYYVPLTQSLDVAIATFIGNAISVVLMSFLLMPFVIRLLGWWLSPSHKHRRGVTYAGTFLVCALYLIEIAVFWNFF